jgi:hypothetical protein
MMAGISYGFPWFAGCFFGAAWCEGHYGVAVGIAVISACLDGLFIKRE